MVRMITRGRRGGGQSRPPVEEGEPEEVNQVGEVMHSCEGNQLLCKSCVQQVPWFNKNIYLENKSAIGKVDEVLGPASDFVPIT